MPTVDELAFVCSRVKLFMRKVVRLSIDLLWMDILALHMFSLLDNYRYCDPDFGRFMGILLFFSVLKFSLFYIFFGP